MKMAQAKTSADNLQYSGESVQKTNMNSTIVAFMHNMWRESKMCDVTLATKDDDLLAHKLILGAFSDLLVCKFSSESSGEMIVIDLPLCSTDIVQQVLNFIYTSNLIITDTNISDLIGCSMRLGVAIIMDKCMDHLRFYNTDNAYFYHSIAEKHSIQGLEKGIFSFICAQFVEISREESFLHIPYEKLLKSLGDDRLSAISELDIFHAMMRWVDYNRQERLSMLPDLMECVRLPLIAPDMLISDIQVDEQIFNIKECRDQLYTAMW